jgi:hypothetical protein
VEFDPSSSIPPDKLMEEIKRIEIQVLATMKLKALRLKIGKIAKRLKSQVNIWLKQGSQYILLSENDDHKDLDWLGIIDQSLLMFTIAK